MLLRWRPEFVSAFFRLQAPANSGDTVLYEQIAANWLHHHIYAMDVQVRLPPWTCVCPDIPHSWR